jgi:hypothetical protein
MLIWLGLTLYSWVDFAVPTLLDSRAWRTSLEDVIIALILMLLPVGSLVLRYLKRSKRSKAISNAYFTVTILSVLAVLGYVLLTTLAPVVMEAIQEAKYEKEKKECLEQGGHMDFGGCGFGGCFESCQMPGQPPNCNGMGCEEHYGPFLDLQQQIPF